MPCVYPEYGRTDPTDLKVLEEAAKRVKVLIEM